MENIKPLISIIVPVYGVEKYLPACIESILGQTYKNIELILVNDGSPDNCGEICDAYAEKDPRIKVVHKENGGVSSARNAGLDIASGELIGFIDSDDTISPTMYEELYSELVRTNSDVSVCKLRRVRTDKEASAEVGSENIVRTEYTREEIIAEMIMVRTFSGSLCNKLFKAGLVKDVRLDTNIYAAEDLLFAVEAILKAKKACYFSRELYNYFTRDGSATQISFSEKHITSHTVCLKIIDLLEAEGLADKMKKYTDASIIVCNVILLRRLSGDKALQKKYARIFKKNLMPHLNKQSFKELTRSIKTNVVPIAISTSLYYFSLNILKKLKSL